MHKTAKEGDSCPKCETQLRTILCARCYGSGKLGERHCKSCGGTGITRVPEFPLPSDVALAQKGSSSARRLTNSAAPASRGGVMQLK
jgi:hypothetical protein